MTTDPEMGLLRLKYEDPDNPDPLRTLALVLAGVVRGAPLPRWAFWEIRRLIMEHPERTKRPGRGGTRSALETIRHHAVDLFRFLEVEVLRERTGRSIGEELFEAAARNLDEEPLLAGSWQAIRASYYRHKRRPRVLG
jgi:hypothetical protein